MSNELISRVRCAFLAALTCASGALAGRAQDACGLPGLCLAPDGANAWVSSPNATFAPLQADAFTAGEDGAVTSVCLWGISWNGSQDCAGDDAFVVTYFADDAGGACPGSVRAGPFAVTGSRSATGATLQGSAVEYRWSLAHPEVAVAAGERLWIGVQSSARGCFFWWETSSDDDGSHCERREGEDLTRRGDLAFCVDIGAEGCPTRVAASDTGVSPRARARLLANAYALRNGALAGSPTGRRWTRLYYEHGPAMARLLRERPALRRRAALLLAIVAPRLEDAARGVGDARVPPHAVALLHAFLDELEEADAGGALAAAVASEREALLALAVPGLPYAEAWRQLDGPR